MKCLGAGAPLGFLSVLSANVGAVPKFVPFDGVMPAYLPAHPAIAIATLALLAGCSAAPVSAAGTSSTTTEATTAATDAVDASSVDLGAVGTLDSAEVHELSLSFEDADYQAMLDTYTSTGDKEWIEATVTIDGETYERAGIRLKGNSSLGGRGAAAGVPGPGCRPTTRPRSPG